jgi:hypothetical protein
VGEITVPAPAEVDEGFKYNWNVQLRDFKLRK